MRRRKTNCITPTWLVLPVDKIKLKVYKNIFNYTNVYNNIWTVLNVCCSTKFSVKTNTR